jgi:hypothetical protein
LDKNALPTRIWFGLGWLLPLVMMRSIDGHRRRTSARPMPSIDPSGISISKYTTYFVPLKQSNRLVGIAGGKDVVASVVQFIGCGQTDECFIFDN